MLIPTCKSTAVAALVAGVAFAIGLFHFGDASVALAADGDCVETAMYSGETTQPKLGDVSVLASNEFELGDSLPETHSYRECSFTRETVRTTTYRCETYHRPYSFTQTCNVIRIDIVRTLRVRECSGLIDHSHEAHAPSWHWFDDGRFAADNRQFGNSEVPTTYADASDARPAFRDHFPA